MFNSPLRGRLREWRKGERVAAVLDAENGEEEPIKEEDTAAHADHQGLLKFGIRLSRCSENERDDHE